MVNSKIIWQTLPKGQIISEVNCGVLNFQKNKRNYSKNFCPSQKMGQIKKIKSLYYIKRAFIMLI